MSPLSAELAECSLYEHIGKRKGKPDMEMSLRWAVEVAEGNFMSFGILQSNLVFHCKDWSTFMTTMLFTET